MNRLTTLALGGLWALLAAFVASTFYTTGTIFALYGLTAIGVVLRGLLSPRPGGPGDLIRGPWGRGASSEIDGGSASTATRNLSAVGGWPDRFRPFFLVALGVLIATVVATWQWSTRSRDGFVLMLLGAENIAHTALFGGFAVWLLSPSRGHVALLSLGMFVMLACTAGVGGILLIGQAAIAMAGAVGFLLLCQIVCQRQPGHAGATAPPLGPSPRLLGDGVNGISAAIVMSLVLLSTSLVTRVTNDAFPRLQQQVVRYVAESLDRADAAQAGDGGRYVTGTRFGTVRSHMLVNSSALALRGYSETAPGYLRGSVFSRYENRRWANPAGSMEDLRQSRGSYRAGPARWVNPGGSGTQSITGTARRAMRRFDMRPQGETGPATFRVAPLEIRGVASRGAVFFSPLHTIWLEAVAVAVQVSDEGLVVSGPNNDEPYILGVARGTVEESLPEGRRAEFLRVAPEVDRMTAALAGQLCPPAAPATAKAAAVARFFQSEFEYSLTHAPAFGRDDPVDFFLKNRHPAHCEYFATAAALILRQAGVPTRYVTGYVMAERDDKENSWVARNANAHAWVEAYDDRRRVWFPVEATPGREYQTLFDDAVTDLGVDAAAAAGIGGTPDKSPWYERLWEWMWTIDWPVFLGSALQSALFPVLLVLLFVLWYRLRRSAMAGLDPEDYRSLQGLRRVERRLRTRSIVRAEHETLHQFADRLDAASLTAEGDWAKTTLPMVAAWYREYAAARYRGRQSPPPPDPPKFSFFPGRS